MTRKKSIKKLMAVGIPRNIARMWLDVGTEMRITNGAVVWMASYCEGVKPAEIVFCRDGRSV